MADMTERFVDREREPLQPVSLRERRGNEQPDEKKRANHD
jgi:hypothetical protein